MGHTLIDHSNDVKMFKTQESAWFHGTVFEHLDVISMIHNVDYEKRVFSFKMQARLAALDPRRSCIRCSFGPFNPLFAMKKKTEIKNIYKT